MHQCVCRSEINLHYSVHLQQRTINCQVNGELLKRFDKHLNLGEDFIYFSRKIRAQMFLRNKSNNLAEEYSNKTKMKSFPYRMKKT